MNQLTMITDVYNNVTYEVKGKCAACLRSADYTFEEAWVFNTRSGFLHRYSWNYTDKTSCGKDCTGETWLHQE